MGSNACGTKRIPDRVTELSAWCQDQNLARFDIAGFNSGCDERSDSSCFVVHSRPLDDVHLPGWVGGAGPKRARGTTIVLCDQVVRQGYD